MVRTALSLKKTQDAQRLDPENIWQDDRLRRKDMAQNILVPAIKNMYQPFVMSIEAPFGGGKSFFLERLRLELIHDYSKNTTQNRGAAQGNGDDVGSSQENSPQSNSKKQNTLAPALVVALNAWQSDYADDPLMALVASLDEELGRYYGESEEADSPYTLAHLSADEQKNIRDTLTEHRRKLLNIHSNLWQKTKIAGEGLFELATAGSDIVQPGTRSILQPIKKTTKKLMAAKSTSLIQSKYHAFQQSQKLITEFRQELGELAQYLKTISGFPLVIILDELDRCHPDYAIRCLEVFKHFFEVKNTTILIGMDREQLKSSASVVFGSATHGEGYLKKFIDYRLNLPKPDLVAYTQYRLECFGLDEYIEKNMAKRNYTGAGLFVFAYHSSLIFYAVNAQLRDIDKLFSN